MMKEEEWQELKEGDRLIASCPYCNNTFNPKITYKEYDKKCSQCKRKFRYWSAPYTVVKVKKGDPILELEGDLDEI